MSRLYNQLNIYYNKHEDLYLYNRSAVNFALASLPSVNSVLEITENGIETFYIKKHMVYLPCQ